MSCGVAPSYRFLQNRVKIPAAMKRFRRFSALLFGVVAPLLFLSVASNPKHAKQNSHYFAYAGTYTAKTSSQGIYAYRFDAETGKLDSIGVAAETTAPSFLAVHPSGKFLYAVNEVGDFHGEKSGAVSAFAIEHKAGKLTLLNQIASGGADPCYISFDKTGKFVLVANYTGGSFSVFPILDGGKLGKATAFVQSDGHGVNPERQEGPHPHWIETAPDNRFALVADLGLDEVGIYRFNATKGTLGTKDSLHAMVADGAGPRHISFHPNGKIFYLLNEMQGTVHVYSYHASGEMRPRTRVLQEISTLPADYASAKENTTAEIALHPSGMFLYASNRGHDSLVVFAIDAGTGKLTNKGYIPTGGKTPRHFAIDPSGKYLLAENQDSNNIVVFKINPATGGLTATGQEVKVPAPVCIVFVAAN